MPQLDDQIPTADERRHPPISERYDTWGLTWSCEQAHLGDLNLSSPLFQVRGKRLITTEGLKPPLIPNSIYRTTCLSPGERVKKEGAEEKGEDSDLFDLRAAPYWSSTSLWITRATASTGWPHLGMGAKKTVWCKRRKPNKKYCERP